jgi:hypothetical protein
VSRKFMGFLGESSIESSNETLKKLNQIEVKRKFDDENYNKFL